MFGMSWGEIIIVITVGMFVLGPERIPVAVKWVGSTLKTVRTMAAGAQEQLQGEFGPELEELKRQIADLQSLKEIQELRTLRDLNPRSLITKNILGEEFSGGFSGLLGLNQTTGTPPATGSGVAAEPEQLQPEPTPTETAETPTPVEWAPDASGQYDPASIEPDDSKLESVDPSPPAVTINEPPALTKTVLTKAWVDAPVITNSAENGAAGNQTAPAIDLVKAHEAAPRHLAAAAFDIDAT